MFVALFFYSCQKKALDLEIGEIKDNTVTLEQAKKIAILNSMFSPIVEGGSGKQVFITKSENNNPAKQIKDFLSVNYTQANPSYYIINYEEGGFIIVAGDDRINPILAHSETGYFPVEGNDITLPSGLVGWLASTDEQVEKIRREGIGQSNIVSKSWNQISQQSNAITKASYMECPECEYDGQVARLYETYGPYLSTKWEQGRGFNDSLTYMNCTDISNGKPLVGCVPVAVAQIMAYHKYPSFDWANMPPRGGSPATAQFMAMLGRLLGVSYSCEGSGAQVPNAANCLKQFGYTSATWKDYYSSTEVTKNLTEGKPVILRGGRKSGWWIFGSYADGHAWVCDGFHHSIDMKCHMWEDDGDPHTDEFEWYVSAGSTVLLHMNWGWGGDYDGNYFTDKFNPGDNTFNYKVGMITNIKP